jgi:sugar phosphate isomerase/epimerase
MPRPVTLFTGQWADLPLAELAPKVKAMGYDGVELACWGDHFEVDRALTEPDYIKNKWALLQKHGLSCFAISTHLVGQAVCDRIDERHQAILPPDVWGDGDPEGVRQRAAEKVKATGRAARQFFNARPGGGGQNDFPAVVNGFTGSSIWHALYAFPPTNQDYLK